MADNQENPLTSVIDNLVVITKNHVENVLFRSLKREQHFLQYLTFVKNNPEPILTVNCMHMDRKTSKKKKEAQWSEEPES